MSFDPPPDESGEERTNFLQRDSSASSSRRMSAHSSGSSLISRILTVYPDYRVHPTRPMASAAFVKSISA